MVRTPRGRIQRRKRRAAQRVGDNTSKIGNKRTRFVTRAVAVFAIVLVLVSGTVLAGGASASGGVACSVSGSTITVTWTGKQSATGYVVTYKPDYHPHAAEIDVDWSGKGNENGSLEISGLATGRYTTKVFEEGQTWGPFSNILINELGSAICTVGGGL